MDYEVQNFESLLGTPGFSDQLLNNHFKLYNGYVANINKILERLQSLELGTPEYAELKRRLGWEYNGMRLHEYYFGNLKNGGAKLDESSTLATQINNDFGSFEKWEEDFKATGAMRGIGWVVMYYDEDGGRLINTWINEHDLGHLAGAKPILIMDVFEHAFMIDYGLKKGEYIDNFMKAIDWGVVTKRFGK